MTTTTTHNVELVLITPELAHEYLGQNTHNRALRHRVVSAYAADMANGDWLWNGESIKFAADGQLLDGQHRLAAIVEADVPVNMLVIRGLPNIAQETMDGGAKRKFSDVLKLRGESSYVTLAATVRAVAGWQLGHRGGAPGNLTNAQLLKTLEEFPWLRDGVTQINYVGIHSGLPASVAGLLWWLTVQIDAEDSDGFFRRLCSQENHKSTDPVFELRKCIANSSSVRGERSTRYLLAVSIKAWNKYRAGEPVGQLKFRPGGANPESFPEPK